MPLSDGSSPSHGSDRNGPTAVLLSQYQSTNWNAANRACRLLNMKMAPKTVEGEEGTKKLVDLIRAFINLRVWHLQMNIINRETLVARPEGSAEVQEPRGPHRGLQRLLRRPFS